VTHMVIFRSPEGKPGYHQAEGLDAAMRFAEMLRNQEQVTDARIFRMDEVPIEFKTYYRVEMVGGGEIADAVTENVGPLESDPPPEPPAEELVETNGTATGQEGEPEPVEAAAASSGRSGLFSRG